jgi:hypothetical protein
MRDIIAQLRALGFQVEAVGEVVTWRWQGTGHPDPARARPLVELLKAHKSEALAALRGELSESLADWPENWLEAFIERSAIMEFDGGSPRAEAERRAEGQVREAYWQTRGPPDAARSQNP